MPTRDNRLHRSKRLKRRIQVNRVEDPKTLLLDLRTKTCRSTKHLFVEDPAADPSKEDEVGDLGHVDGRLVGGEGGGVGDE